MHKTQKFIVLVGIILIILMGVYPPWLYIDEGKIEHPMGYAPIWRPPIERHHNTAELFGVKLQLDFQDKTANTIDLFRLFMQIAVLSAVTGGAVVLLRRASA